MAITIRPARPGDEPRWRELWTAYNRFYEHEVPEAITRSTWSRILDPASSVRAVVAQDVDGTTIGFANYIVHDGTWSIESVCCLEDLYVDRERRARGVGRLLIDWLVAEMKAKGWAKLYWITHETNYRARSLYDTYTAHSGFLRYVIPNRTEP